MSGHIELAVERELSGLQALEQKVERHDLGERGRMAQRVRIGRVQHGAVVGVDHDVGVARLELGRRGGALGLLAACARFSRIGNRDTRNGRGNAEQTPAEPARGPVTATQHDYPRPRYSTIPRVLPPEHPIPVLFALGYKWKRKKRRIWGFSSRPFPNRGCFLRRSFGPIFSPRFRPLQLFEGINARGGRLLKS